MGTSKMKLLVFVALMSCMAYVAVATAKTCEERLDYMINKYCKPTDNYNFFLTKSGTFAEVAQDCKSAGGELVNGKTWIHTKYHGAIRDVAKTASTVYIGLTDQKQEKTWVFTDGTKLGREGPVYWARYQPDNWHGHKGELKNGEDCGTMWYHGTSLNDISCKTVFPGLCQARKLICLHVTHK